MKKRRKAFGGIRGWLFQKLFYEEWKWRISNDLVVKNLENRLRKLECEHPIKWRVMKLDVSTYGICGVMYYHEECEGCEKDFGVYKGENLMKKRKKEIMQLQIKEL